MFIELILLGLSAGAVAFLGLLEAAAPELSGPRASRPLACEAAGWRFSSEVEYAGGTPAVPAGRAHKGWHARGYLPHFDSGAFVQALAFRLADSLPEEVYDEAVAAASNDAERRRRLDAMIDSGRGSRLLLDPENAAIVRNALDHFDGERYRLLAWTIMPNHVHVMIEQVEGHPLDRIIQAWKSFTAKAINQRRGDGGRLWAPDYFDRFVRNEAHYAAAIRYIEDNPVKAGLAREASAWRFSSAAAPDLPGARASRPLFRPLVCEAAG